jgi:hypothetical protein
MRLALVDRSNSTEGRNHRGLELKPRIQYAKVSPGGMKADAGIGGQRPAVWPRGFAA